MMQANAWRLALQVWAVRHGLWIVPGVAALCLALAAWVGWVPAQERALRDALAQLATQGKTVVPARQPAAEGARLPNAPLAQEGVQELFVLAREQGLTITQADYRRQDSGRLGRWQVQMPAAGTYPQIRRFVRAAQAVPGLSVDELAVRRSETGVEARLLFSIWFAQEGAMPLGEVR